MVTKILSSHLKEAPKQYIEVYYIIFTSALFRFICFKVRLKDLFV